MAVILRLRVVARWNELETFRTHVGDQAFYKRLGRTRSIHAVRRKCVVGAHQGCAAVGKGQLGCILDAVYESDIAALGWHQLSGYCDLCHGYSSSTRSHCLNLIGLPRQHQRTTLWHSVICDGGQAFVELALTGGCKIAGAALEYFERCPADEVRTASPLHQTLITSTFMMGALSLWVAGEPEVRERSGN